MDVIIWDTDAARINTIERNVRAAMRRSGISGLISVMSEPPLVGRAGLIGKTPVLEIGDKYWSLKPGQGISIEQCLALFGKLSE